MDNILSRITTNIRSSSGTVVLSSLFLAALTVYGLKSYKTSIEIRRIIPSPRETLLSRLSEEEQLALPYPPNLLPGSRDVKTPYGTIRVYEWGPETGKKIAFVHGDSTPCPIWARVANQLADAGFRVLTFDLYGRGYSDAPAHEFYGLQLYVHQLLFAVTSSPLSWTGTGSSGFSLVGFSLGGVIALDFLRTFPTLVNSIVLLGPAGLLRSLPSSYTTLWFRYPELITTSYLRKLAARALGVDFNSTPLQKQPSNTIDLQAICQWQFDHHEGLVTSFVGTIRSGAPHNQEEIWHEACAIIKQRARDLPQAELNSKGGRLLLLTGDEDWVVPRMDNIADCDRLLGKDNYMEKTLPGDHGFIWANSERITDILLEFWR